MDPGSDGHGVPAETWDGLTGPGVAEAMVTDMLQRVPQDWLDRLGTRPTLRHLARRSLAYAISPGLMDALQQADPEAAQHFADLARQEQERHG